MSHPRGSVWIALGALGALAWTGCEPATEGAKGEPAQEASSQGAASAAGEPPAQEAEPEPEATLEQKLAAFAQQCELAKPRERACRPAQRELDAHLKRLRMGALGPLVEALEGPGREGAIYGLSRQLPYFMDDAIGRELNEETHEFEDVVTLDESAARALVDEAIAIDPKTQRDEAMALIPVAIEIGSLAGMHERVGELLESLREAEGEGASALYRRALRQSMKHGRMRHFELVEQAAQAEDPALRRVAFEAPQQMFKWTDEESERICEWARGYLKEDDPRLNAGPAQLMLRCNHALVWRTRLLDEAGRRLDQGRYGRPFSRVLGSVCVPPVRGATPAAGQTVCERAQFVLRQAAEDEELRPRERAYALEAIAKQWQGKETVTYLERFVDHPDEHISRQAKRSLKELRSDQGGAAPAGPESAGAREPSPKK